MKTHVTPRLYTDEQINQVRASYVPKHVAIIMDGNRRWAKKRLLPTHAGHWRGADTLTHIVRAAGELGIKTLTVFGFSTENTKRSPKEVDSLMRLMKQYLIKQRPKMVEEGVRLHTIGDLSSFPDELIEEIHSTKELTKDGSTIDLVLALGYGSRDEIKRASQALAADCLLGKVSIDSIDEETFAGYLDTASWCDPDLVIRTSGESRLSNFLLWQASYAEVFISPILWPDFTAKDLLQTILEFQHRERRKGL